MIKTSTVLVLGAGASKPYGFPLGSELRQSICAGAFPGSSSICEQLAAIDNEISAIEIKQFARQFLESGIDSIDSFLDRWSTHDELGRKIIAYLLIQKEHRNNIFNPDNVEDWYRRLWNNLVRDTQNAGNLASNKLKVLTFNYDRSLEHFFHSATKNTYRVNDAAAHESWGKIPIVHTYGLLGGYSYDSTYPPKRVFESDLTCQHLHIASASLKIIQQTRNEDEVFQTARRWFDEA